MKKPRKTLIFSQPDYDVGYHHGSADMFKSFSDALTAVGIQVRFEPYLAYRDNGVVMLFRAILLDQDGQSIITPVVTDRHRSPATPGAPGAHGHETDSG